MKEIVLILVLMEDALRAYIDLYNLTFPNSLNPCSNGRCSASSLLGSYL